MRRPIAPALLAFLLLAGCAGPAKLAERSQQKLATGDHWRAWQLATRALDKAPANADARRAAAMAAASITDDWARRITALAGSDSLGAADEVLRLVDFRTAAIPYTTVAVTPGWAESERTLRHAAARHHYRLAMAAPPARRPKRAHFHFLQADRFVADYRDCRRQAERAYEKALTPVAIAPFLSPGNSSSLGREVATTWRDDLSRRIPERAQFTQILGADALEQSMTVAQARRLSREDVVRLGRKAGAERVVWGSIGAVRSETGLHLFTDHIHRRIVEKTPEGGSRTRWVEIPIEVVARVRDVTVDVEHDILSTASGASLAHGRSERTRQARVVWTSFVPEGDINSYVLVSETLRSTNPERAKQIETRWKTVCGAATTLHQVLEARRTTKKDSHYGRDVLPRFIAGAAFVFLQELPPAEDLAYAALAGGWGPLAEDLTRLDAMDDIDLGAEVAGSDER